MSEADTHKKMIKIVAQALGDELLKKVVFVGGCTTGLLITDAFSLEQVRHTQDVDLIVHVIGYAEWHQLQGQLRIKGFQDITNESAPICAMKLGELRVDFMPDDERLLGFSNRWYQDALDTAQLYDLDSNIKINLVTPGYFIGTKLEAYKGRGQDDPLTSQDIEDILNLFDGRESLIDELAQSPSGLRSYIAGSLSDLLTNPAMDHAIQGTSQGDAGREKLIYKRIQDAIALDK